MQHDACAGEVQAVFLGPLGTYTHQVVRILEAGKSSVLSPESSIKSVFERGAQSSVAQPCIAVAPFWNSNQGAVIEAMECLSLPDLFDKNKLHIVDEVELRIAHALIIPKDCCASSEKDMFAQIQVVRSHPQALGQCSKFIAKNLGHAVQEPTTSTAEAVSRLDAPNAAAIASDLSAELLGARVLCRGIQNASDNITRFLVTTTDPDNDAIDAFLTSSRTRWTTGTVAKTMFRIYVPQADEELVRKLTASLLSPTSEWSLVEDIYVLHGVLEKGDAALLLELQQRDDAASALAAFVQLCMEPIVLPYGGHLECLGTWRAEERKKIGPTL